MEKTCLGASELEFQDESLDRMLVEKPSEYEAFDKKMIKEPMRVQVTAIVSTMNWGLYRVEYTKEFDDVGGCNISWCKTDIVSHHFHFPQK